MDLMEIREYALTLPEVEESMPFGDEVLVFKVAGKMFLALWLGARPERIALKCDPDRAIELRDRHPEITSAWHFNKRHWNDIVVEGDLPAEVIRHEIRHAWVQTVLSNVSPKALRERLLGML
uniref:MmcQ/YjbR family DNA-binding protein n=1 Tax=Alistipes sp. TaxID=1872444 RepID=UPI004055B398